MTAATVAPPARADRTIVAAGVLLGLGLGGFVDGIVLHQILQWHHMLTDYGDYATFPATDVPALEDNTLWDGLFHAATWVFVVAGLYLFRRGTARGGRATVGGLTALMLFGWGLFNLVEGLVNHHLLGIHHVRDDVAEPLPWDLGFLALGAALLVTGWALYRAERARSTLPGA